MIKDYMTSRWSMLSRMDWARTPYGYLVEGYEVHREGDGWRIEDLTFGLFTDALDWIVSEINTDGRFD